MADDKKKEKGEKAAAGGDKPEKPAKGGGGGGGGEKAAAPEGAAAKKPAGDGKAKGKKVEKKDTSQTHLAKEGEVARHGAPRLKTLYDKEVAPALMKEFGFANRMQVPRIRKITLNMGLGEAIQNPKVMDSAVEELTAIAGQKPVVTKAKKSIATYKLREGQKIGCMVTLRRERMWEFLDRLVSLALPRVRDFKGVSPRAFDGRGNYSLGIREQIIFPEINYDKIDKIKGLNVSIVTTARTDEEGRALLRSLGMPFRA
jgi:large subunit ribosomal protein L5